MSGIILSKVKYFSLAKVLAIYGFLMAILTIIVDLIIKLISGSSYFYPTAGWSTWALFAVTQIILLPIFLFIAGYVLGFIINMSLKAAKGLEIETL